MKFLQISIPKAGTHLFENMTLARIANLPLVFGGITQLFPSQADIEARFNDLEADGRYKAHLPYFEGVERLLEQFEHVIFILRDPRDIIVSMAHFIGNLPTSVFNWKVDGKPLSERPLSYRIDYLIENMPPVFSRFDPWLDVEGIEIFRYEDHHHFPGETYRRLEKMGLGTVSELKARAKKKAYTFRAGTIENWKNEFTPPQKQKANANYAAFVSKWGYSVSAMEKVFTGIYKVNYWRSKETRSGGGSEILRTRSVRAQLVGMLNKYKIKSVLDAGCGDWNWMSKIEFGEIRVSGCDIVKSVVSENCEKYGERFFVADLTKTPLPKAELILCRLVLNHLTFENIHKALENFKRSGAKYVLLTHYLDEKKNIDKSDGDWRPLNYRLPPFEYPEPLETIQEESGCLALWRLS